MLTLLKSGIHTTIQDRGRFFGAHLGIPFSGAMDSQSADIANLILGNGDDNALLECTFTGPKIEFCSPTLIAIVGAQIPTFLNEVEIKKDRAITIKTGDILHFGRIEKGSRFYIGIKGGFHGTSIYKSRSTCTTAGILKQLKNGDRLSYSPFALSQTSSVSIKRILGNNKLAVCKGPEYSLLSSSEQENIFDTNYSVKPESNRMAFRINHNLKISHSYSMLSSGTLPGTVQLTPSGQMIILMRDTQTTGGYPRILQLTEEAINDLAQLMIGEEFTLELNE